ncbi:hypothetical protein N7513_007246 [Penicillium frequentans]|nr:hypothetical protein N7513_007246 [Penicillium glabrum]
MPVRTALDSGRTLRRCLQQGIRQQEHELDYYRTSLEDMDAVMRNGRTEAIPHI